MNTLQEKADALLAQPLSQGPTVAELRRRATRRRRRRVTGTLVGCGLVAALAVAAVVSLPADGDVSVASGPADPTTVPVTYPPGYTPPSWCPTDGSTTTGSTFCAPPVPNPKYAEPLRSQIVTEYRAFADCMTRNGYPYMETIPDSYGDGQTPMGISAVVPGFESQHQHALDSCRAELDKLNADTLAAHTADVVTGQRATTPLEWSNEQAVLEPAPDGENPTIDAAAAIAAASAYVSPDVAAQATPTVLYGLYTSQQGGNYIRQPVWIVWYRNVRLPYLPSVDPLPGPSGTSSPPTTIVGDLLTVVDANSGTVLVAGSQSPPIDYTTG